MVFIAPLRLGFEFRGKILEAMSLSIPVVTTSLGSEVIEVKKISNIIIADEPDNFDDNLNKIFIKLANKLIKIILFKIFHFL